MNSPRISVVIINYNVKDLLLKCLYSLFHINEFKEIEVIVVDNASTDGSIEEIDSKFPCVVIRNKENSGFAVANNQGIRIAKGKYIFMLNPDTEVNSGAIEILYSFFQNTPDVVIAGPRLFNSDGTVQLSTWNFTTLTDSFLKVFSLKIRNSLFIGTVTSPLVVKSLSGAALFFTKADFEKVGGLDGNFFWYEDDDFCFRLQKETGRKAYYVPTSKIIHHVSRSARQDYRIPIANQLISRLKFYKKHYSRLKQSAILLITVLHIIIHVIVFSFISFFNAKGGKKLKAYLFATRMLLSYLSGRRKGIILP